MWLSLLDHFNFGPIIAQVSINTNIWAVVMGSPAQYALKSIHFLFGISSVNLYYCSLYNNEIWMKCLVSSVSVQVCPPDLQVQAPCPHPRCDP